MASKNGLHARIRQAIRKRQEKPRPQPIQTGNVRRDRWEEITRGHPEVLHVIESTILRSWSVVPGVDDYWAHMGLIGAMRDDPPDHPCSWDVYWRLQQARELRDDVPAEIWLDALRVVDQSVRDHSSLQHGDRSYLAFILQYVEAAVGSADDGEDYRIIEGRVEGSELDRASEQASSRAAIQAETENEQEND